MSLPKLIYAKKGQYAAFPWAIRLDTGRILLAFRIATRHMIDPEGRVAVMYSDDDGGTWSPPLEVSNHWFLDDREPAMVQLPNGRIWMTTMGQRHYPRRYTTHLLNSHDDGKTWSMPLEYTDDLLRHPFLQEGRLAFAGNLGPQVGADERRIGYRFEPEAQPKRGIVELFETPGGWGRVTNAFPKMGYGDEWMVTDGYAVFREAQWAPDNEEWIWGCDLYGNEAPQKLLWHGQIPSRPWLLKLHDGRLLAAVDRRASRETVARIRGLDGEWGEEFMLVPKCEATEEGWDFGYPNVVEIPRMTKVEYSGMVCESDYWEHSKLLTFFYGYIPGREKDRGIWMQEVKIPG